MIKVVEDLLQDFEQHTQTCELEVCYDDKLCKIKRMGYLPDEEGKVVFHKEDKWTNDGYTIIEATEFLKNFGEGITSILFEAYDGSYQEYLNSYEVVCDTANTEYRLRILVGADRPLSFPDNVVYKSNIPITTLL